MDISQERQASISLSQNVFEILTAIALCTLIFSVIQYYWKRRHLYKLAAEVHGPSPLPIIGNALEFAVNTTDIINILANMNSKYPSPFKFWIGQNLFYGIFEPEDLEIVMNSQTTLNKDDIYNNAACPVVGRALYTVKVPFWKKERKIAASLFNQKTIDGFTERFGLITTFYSETELMSVAGKGRFDVYPYLENIILASLCETIVGTEPTKEAIDNFKYWLGRGMEIVYLRVYKIWYQWNAIFKLLPISKEMNQIIDDSRAFILEIFNNKMSLQNETIQEQCKTYPYEDVEKENRSFLDALIEMKQKDDSINDKQLIDELITLSVGAHDTSTIVTSCVLLMLGMHPDIQQRVYEEVMEVLGPDRIADPKDLPKLKYFDRVVKETLRLFPPGPLLNRTVESDLALKSCVLPKGASIIIGVVHVHRDPKYWPNPLKFDPDRFLPEEIEKRHPYSYIPFSAGMRKCVGIRFGMTGIKTMIPIIVRKFKISTEFKSVEELELQATLMLYLKNGWKLSLEVR